MNIKDTVQFNKEIYLLGEDGCLYTYYWNYKKTHPEYELKFISNSENNTSQQSQIISLYTDDRNLYGLANNGCIFRFVEGKYNLSKVNWILNNSSDFIESSGVSVKQIINNNMILASDNKVYEWTWVNGKYGWIMMGKPTSYLVSSVM